MAIKIDLKASLESKSKTGGSFGTKSIKSLRSYQVGVVYKDVYGRETPVFTNEKALFTTPKISAPNENTVVASLKNTPPDWADTYKFFIKETSNEYYNLCMDRWYDAEDGNIWISFPSAERNKVQEDTFIILKKKADSSQAITDEARYKVLDIKNEAPDFIKTDYEQYGSASLLVLGGGSALAGTTLLKIDDTQWEDSVFYDGAIAGGNTGDSGLSVTGFVGWPLKDVVIKLTGNGATTGWLDVANIYRDTDYFIKVSKSFKEDNIEPVMGDSTANQTPNVRLARKVVKNKSEFNGRFFVKLRRDAGIETHVRSVSNPAPSISVVKTQKYYAIKGDQSSGTLYDTFYKSIGENFIIDRAKRTSVGTGGSRGSKGPYSSHDGYGIQGNRSGDMGAYTMDLTFHRINDDSKADYKDKGEGFDTSQNDPDKLDFFETLKSVGTLFRFQEDPYQHIYRVESSVNSIEDTNLIEKSHGIFNYSSKKKYRKTKTNKAHRLHLKFKTTGWRMEDLDNPGTAMTEADSNTAIGAGFQGRGYIGLGNDDIRDKWPFAYGANNFTSDDSYVAPGGWLPTEDASGTDIEQHVNSTWVSGNFNNIQIVSTDSGDGEAEFAKNPAIWETEPKEDKGLDIYYEASQAYPVSLTQKTNELFAPYGCVVTCEDTMHSNKSVYIPDGTVLWDWTPTGHGGDTILLSCKTNEIGIIDNTKPFGSIENGTGINPGEWTFDVNEEPIQPEMYNSGILTNPELGNFSEASNGLNDPTNGFIGIELKFTRQDGSFTTARVNYFSGWISAAGAPPFGDYFVDGKTFVPSLIPFGRYHRVLIKLDRSIADLNIGLPYFNCWTFGNGVESDRIRDDFNAIRLDKGVKASTVLDEPYEEERRASGLIYSGIYNSNSGINNLNQFIAGEKITKDAQPSYGSIQKLKARDTNLIAFCEDKVLKIQAYKDALYKADGNPDIISTNKVLGDITSFAGEFGISKNPESFAEESFRMYFTDKQRGKVLRLSGDGITPISEVGMKDWFADNLKLYDNLIGSFDDRKGEYNLTMTKNPIVSAPVVNPGSAGGGGFNTGAGNSPGAGVFNP